MAVINNIYIYTPMRRGLLGSLMPLAKGLKKIILKRFYAVFMRFLGVGGRAISLFLFLVPPPPSHTRNFFRFSETFPRFFLFIISCFYTFSK